MRAQLDIGATLRCSRTVLISILIYHAVLFAISVFLIARLWVAPDAADEPRMFFMTGLFALLGNVIYFSRKCYVYLITDKFVKLADGTSPGASASSDHLSRVLTGYYLYLIFRPISGIAIGPILYMLVVSGGLITFAGVHVGNSITLSVGGKYLICAASFLAGHASSDMFDYFSWVAASRIRKRKNAE
jgi:hypothetical protein